MEKKKQEQTHSPSRLRIYMVTVSCTMVRCSAVTFHKFQQCLRPDTSIPPLSPTHQCAYLSTLLLLSLCLTKCCWGLDRWLSPICCITAAPVSLNHCRPQPQPGRISRQRITISSLAARFFFFLNVCVCVSLRSHSGFAFFSFHLEMGHLGLLPHKKNYCHIHL